jgi:sugar O-acyltransferase (sialic acid O-acetyltransferase NeuD family)
MQAQSRSAVIWGATGHAKVVHQVLKSTGIATVCLCDRNPAVDSPIPGVPVWHSEEEFLAWLRAGDRHDLSFVAAIGGARGASRLAVHAYLTAMGISAISITHPSAWVDPTATLESGNQVLAMAAVGVDVSLGKQCIVNTNASVDHDTRLGDGVHVMPGATIAGQVVIGDQAVIGSGATILPNLHLGDRAVVGAGAVVTHDVSPGTTVVGVPAAPVATTETPRTDEQDPWRLPPEGMS